jgi:hypothetical protein
MDMAKTSQASVRMPSNIMDKRKNKLFSVFYVLVFGALAATYVVLTLTHTPNSAILHQYHLTETGYHWLLASILVIFGIMWSASLFGSLVFKSYSSLIRTSSDGKALQAISGGLLILSIALPINSCISSINAVVIGHHPELLPKLTIINNYVSVFLMGAAMIFIAIGAEQLYKLARNRPRLIVQRLWVIGFIIGSSLYSYFIVIQPIHTPLDKRVYFLPDLLLVCSIAIPYLVFWYLGLNAAYQINSYRANIRGFLYKSALRYLAVGITVVIASSITTRLIVTVSSRLSHLSLTPLLFVIYGLLIIDAAGFILIAIGASRLRKIEEA